MTTTALARIRSKIDALGARGPGRKYGPDLRREVAAYARARAASGVHLCEIARELDVSEMALHRALTEDAGTIDMSPGLREVRVVEDSEAASAPVVFGPRGLRVEGLDVRGIAALFRALT
jgi:transposase-like protein